MTPPADVAEVFCAAREILVSAGVEHAFIGALAAVAWGRPRATTDVDLVILADEAVFAGVEARLEEAGFVRGGDVGPSDPGESLPDIAVFWSAHDTAVRLDVFIAKTPFEEEVVATARSASVLGTPARLASPEAVIVYKLLAGRRKDLDDVEAVLDGCEAAGEPLDWAFLDRWAAAWEIEERLDALRGRGDAGS